MKKVIVTTTINPPTEAIERFQSMKDWDLVVIGDKKTPKNYPLSRGIYVTPEEQEKYDPALSEAIGWNCIQRRNFGLLWARDLKADIVAVVDDDNIPLKGWGEDLLVGRNVEVNYYETDLPAFDPVGATNHPRLWHRGYPLQLLPKRRYDKKSRKKVFWELNGLNLLLAMGNRSGAKSHSGACSMRQIASMSGSPFQKSACTSAFTCFRLFLP